MTTPNEREARELLAREYERSGMNVSAAILRDKRENEITGAAIRAIIAALTREQREGVQDDPVTLADVAGAFSEAADQYEPGEGRNLSRAEHALLTDFVHGLVEHPLFIVAGHYFAQNPVPGARKPQPEAQGAVAWRCVNGYSDCFGPQGRKCCPDCQYRTTQPAPVDVRDPATLARRFHETYERLAPQFGYETRAETRVFDPESANGKLMIATCAALLDGQPAGVDADPRIALFYEAVELQRTYYGDGSGLHLEMIDWAAKAAALGGGGGGE